jgi:uncharacterized protein
MRHNVTFPSNGLAVAGHLYIPADQAGGRRPAVVVSHPMGAVKEQAAGLYAERLAREGFITLAFDAAYQGESAGEPRFLENPFQRAEDVKSAVTFLATRGEVDAERIGALGICASGGYVPYAAQTDHRIKAVATVTGACVGRLWRDGMDGKQSEEVIRGMLDQAAADRNNEGRGQPARRVPIVPQTEEQAKTFRPRSMFREAYYYYRTPRAQHQRSENWYVFRSVDLIAQYDSYDLIHLIAPRPLLMIHGTDADTARFSREAIEEAREPKELFWIEGASHVDLYDKEEYVSKAIVKLSGFFREHLAEARGSR